MTSLPKDKVEELKKVLEKKKESHDFQEKLKKAEEEAKENHEKWLRAVADLDNYKKRVAREQADHLRYSHETLLRELVKVLDDFDNIIAHLPKEDSPTIQGLIDGIEFVHRDFLNILQKFGLKEIETKDQKFDPHQHEAIAQVESNAHETGAIVECHRKGYQFHDRLLRPASVTVAKEKNNDDQPIK